jgi:hypothetical protein
MPFMKLLGKSLFFVHVPDLFNAYPCDLPYEHISNMA